MLVVNAVRVEGLRMLMYAMSPVIYGGWIACREGFEREGEE